MDGFKVDPDAIERFIKITLDPAIDHFNAILARLVESRATEGDFLLGESRLPGSTAFNEHCWDLLWKVRFQHYMAIDEQRTLATSLQEFRDILQQTVNRYRTTELRNEEILRAIQPPR